MKGKWALWATMTALLLLLAAGLSQAQGPQPQDQNEEGIQPQDIGIAVDVDNVIPIQGRLTDAGGNPLNGSYSITASIYDQESGGTPLCFKTQTVDVSNGLFNMTIDSCTDDDINGRQLYLGIKVGDDAEMTPRQPIYPVPYAMSLMPGADVVGEEPGANAIYAINTATTGYSYGVRAVSHSPNGRGVSGENNAGGIGVYGYSETGIAIKADGTGIIQSTARSYLWISGNALQKANSADTTLFIYDLYGGYQVRGGSDWVHNKTVLVPVTIPGQLYGQNVTVTGLDLYYNTSDDLTGITVSAMRRQNGVGAGDLIFRDETDYVCPAPVQCVKHWDLTANNVLSDERGILYIAFQLSFASETAYVNIGGVRLTLEHD